MLEYDDLAFCYFALSTLSLCLIPSWSSVIQRLAQSFTASDESIGAVYRTSVEQPKVQELRKRSSVAKLFVSRDFLIRLGVALLLTLGNLWIVRIIVQDDGDINTFDPFAILGIDAGATPEAIRKAWKDLVKQWYPQANLGDAVAEAKFIMIQKAYETLTDSTAAENWKRFGNPDGKQSLEVSLGLPSFLVDAKNRNLVLGAYLLVVVVLIPYLVYRYYSDSSQYGEKNVMYSTYSWYHHALSSSDRTSIQELPEVLAGSAEFRNKRNHTSKQALAELVQTTRARMQKPKYHHPVCIMGSVLLHVHLLRQTNVMLNNNMEQEMDDLQDMVRMSTALLDAMISVCKHQDALSTAMRCMEFEQYVTQAMWTKDSNLLQIPHFGVDEVDHSRAGKHHTTSTIAQYRAVSPEHRKGMKFFSDTQKKDVTEFLKIFPDISVTAKVFTDDDDDEQVYEGDLVTVQATITRNNLQDGEKAGLVHAPYFPFPKKEAFWIILGNIKDEKIISIEKVGNPNKTVVHNIKFLAPPKGTYHFDLIVKSNGYVGIDTQVPVEMVTLDAAALPEYMVHPDDAELDDEPTLFEQMMNAQVEEESDDDESDWEDDEQDEANVRSESAKKKEKKEKKKELLQKTRQSGGDDD